MEAYCFHYKNKWSSILDPPWLYPFDSDGKAVFAQGDCLPLGFPCRVSRLWNLEGSATGVNNMYRCNYALRLRIESVLYRLMEARCFRYGMYKFNQKKVDASFCTYLSYIQIYFKFYLIFISKISISSGEFLSV